MGMYYLGVDLGTSSVKLLLINDEGKSTGSVNKAYDVYYPKVGWAEQNPEEWWEAGTQPALFWISTDSIISPWTMPDAAVLQSCGPEARMSVSNAGYTTLTSF